MAWPARGSTAALAPADDAWLEEFSRASFRFFEEQTHPVTGLVRDRARADGSASEGMASIAASGFAFAGWAIAAERGWVPRDAALARVRLMLRFLATGAPRKQGFFYHFMLPATGERVWQCEVSTIDTALCLAGAIAAREHFQDAEVTDLVNRIYGAVDWPWFLNGGETLSLSWRDEQGFSRYRWDKYSEHMVLTLLGLGSPTHPLPADTWHRWSRTPRIEHGGRRFVAGPPLFMHQFAHAFFDFRGKRDAYADYHHNSVLATHAHREMCIALASEFPAWGENLWGVTASDSDRGYHAWGGPPRTRDGGRLDGTIVPCAAAGSLPFTPRESIAALRHMRDAFGDRVWKRYGFVDAFKPATGWFNRDVIGIDVGISLLMAENARTGLVWKMVSRAPEARRAFDRAGFVSTERAPGPREAAAAHALAGGISRSLASAVWTPDTAGLGVAAALAAEALIGSQAESDRRLRSLLAIAPPADPFAAAERAAALLALRQARPALRPEIDRLLAAVDWEKLDAGPGQLGSRQRLGIFLQIGRGTRPASAWSALSRDAVSLGPVQVLAPATVTDQLRPGLWLDERQIVSGASASQLAYATRNDSWPRGGGMAAALLFTYFPSEALARLAELSSVDWRTVPVEERATLLIALGGDQLRAWFQADPLAQRARAAIPEFGEAAFGPCTSLVQQRELAAPHPPRPVRRALARPAGSPRESWDWQTVEGAAFLDTTVDQRPGDPTASMRFAFTWDETALQLHVEATDETGGFVSPARRRRAIEWLLDPQGDGLDWQLNADAKFTYALGAAPVESIRGLPSSAEHKPRPHGHQLVAKVDWAALGLRPAPGLSLCSTVAITASGPDAAAPTTRLTWLYTAEEDGRFTLGTVELAR
ncbi:MAG: hypothetical protein JNL39_16810 [Opitutaceae bacterium]|nr:hypothetical protein [Opitutaceae bacterium]